MPKKLEEIKNAIMKKGVSEKKAFAIATVTYANMIRKKRGGSIRRRK